MTMKDKSNIERLLGVIEGIAFALDNKYSQPINDAIVAIDEILEKEGADNDR
jgi:hypothetical protein